MLYRHRGAFPAPGLTTWIKIIAIGSFYFAGEEASWGQHIFRWATSETWSAVNDQQETNLHNTSWLFDQLPRNLLTLAALVGGLMALLSVFKRRAALDASHTRYWVWPTYVCLPACVFAVFIGPIVKILESAGIALSPATKSNVGESKELFLALFLMLYLYSISIRLKAHIVPND